MSITTETLPSSGFAVNIAGTDLVFRTVFLVEERPTGTNIFKAGGIEALEETVLLQWLESGDFEEIRPDELIHTDEGGVPHLIYACSDRLYRLLLNEHAVLWPDDKISGDQLRKIGRIPEEHTLFIAVKGEKGRKIGKDEQVQLDRVGNEVFYSQAPFWSLNVQGVIIRSDSPRLSVREALLKAGFDPDKDWIIVLKRVDGKVELKIDDIIDLSGRDIEKIRLTPREINNGDARGLGVDSSFSLLPKDDEGLDQRGLITRRVIENGRRWLIADAFPVPPGLSPDTVALALEIPSSYPRAEIDMFYCHPAIRRNDGNQIPQTQVTEIIEGKEFQRWSRHRGERSRWDPTSDSVLTHLALVDAALLVEGGPDL